LTKNKDIALKFYFDNPTNNSEIYFYLTYNSTSFSSESANDILESESNWHFILEPTDYQVHQFYFKNNLISKYQGMLDVILNKDRTFYRSINYHANDLIQFKQQSSPTIAFNMTLNPEITTNVQQI